MSLREYFGLIRPYSIVDVLLLFLLARAVSVSHIQFNYMDLVYTTQYILLWFFLTLYLEAKHKHSYRKVISKKISYILLFLAAFISVFFNIESLVFIVLIWLFTYLYIQKEKSKILGSLSSPIRGLYELSLFLFGVSLFIGLTEISITQFIIGIAIFFSYTARNLIADIRDVAFDTNTFTVRFGSRLSYLISFISYLISTLLLFILFSNILVVFPMLFLAIILLFYDNGYTLHRCCILTTSFTSVNIILFLLSNDIFYINILFLLVLSNIVLYESIPRKSNPTPKIISNVRFLF